MKKLIAILFLTVVTMTTFAQSRTSRIGTTCTGGQLTYAFKAYTTPASTRKIVPNAYSYTVKDTLNASRTDSIVIANAYSGDVLTIIYCNRATADTVTFGAAFAGAAGGYAASGANTSLTSNKLPIPASKTAVITFMFDGQIWREVCHSINL